jgi:16S rRNA (adenine1518-N6/adenine1519-N6)-dimethyltransferase
VRSLFSSRRKTIKNNLQNYLNSRIMTGKGNQNLALELLERAGIGPNERAENLGPAEFSALAAALPGR